MRLLALHPIAGRDRGERTRRRNAHRDHRLGHEEFAQHRPDRGLAIAVAREGRRPRPLELDIEARAIGRDKLAEQQRTTIAELRREMTELVPGIGKRERVGAAGHFLAREEPRELSVARTGNVDTEPIGERPVEYQQPRRRWLRGFGGGVKALHGIVKTIVERNIHGALCRALAP